MQKWMNDGGILYPINGELALYDAPKSGIWKVVQSMNMMDKRLGIEKVADKFEFDYKIYDLGGTEMFDKIKTVWASRQYRDGMKNLGMIYNGTKGTGKTVSAKLLCNELGLPVIIINNTFDGLILDFIQSLEFECIIFIDEAEKTFVDGDQEILLKMIDGVYNKSRKMYLLTTNTLRVNENLISRPGRIRYIQEFGNLPANAVNEYIDDNLLDKTKKDKVLEQVDLLEFSTIDILKALVDEVNILGDIDSKSNLNIPKANFSFDVLKLYGSDEKAVEAVKEFIKLCPSDMSLKQWFKSTPIPDNFQKYYEKDEEGNYIVSYDEVSDILHEYLKNRDIDNEYVYVERMTSKSEFFYTGQHTSSGEVILSPDAIKDNRFMVLKDDYRQTPSLIMILEMRSNPSLYRGSLGQFIL